MARPTIDLQDKIFGRLKVLKKGLIRGHKLPRFIYGKFKEVLCLEILKYYI